MYVALFESALSRLTYPEGRYETLRNVSRVENGLISAPRAGR